eukprot:TRINITY_DN29776_c0_g1_i1.p1 TRINITY_DN29776_c0_g1~~TRINITY_DN29776_c0_g1_i1.p1  ORF type:complete len:479 (-),score=58.07 TRINITY_DN29776_c0_g1_i1:30-1439(-)
MLNASQPRVKRADPWAEDESLLPKKKPDLGRTLTLPTSVALIIGLVIGSGIFASPGYVLDYCKSAGMALVIWGFGGLLTMAGALVYAELGTAIPESGADYVYLRYTFGDLPGILSVWMNALVNKPGSQAIQVIVFSRYICRIWSSDPPWLVSKALSLGALWLITLVNVSSTPFAAKLQGALTSAKFVAMGMIVIVALVQLGKSQHQPVFDTMFEGSSSRLFDYGLAMVNTIHAYDGYTNLNFAAGEVQNAQRTIPLAICLAIPIVAVSYLLVNLSYMIVLPLTEVVSSKAIALDFGLAATGEWGRIFLCVGVAMSTFGACNASIFGGARMLHAAAERGDLPTAVGWVPGRTNTPAGAILFQCVLATILVLWGDFQSALQFKTFGVQVFGTLTAIAFVVLKYREPEMVRPFIAPTAIGVIYILITAVVLVNLAAEGWKDTLLAAGFISLGLPYWYFRRRWAKKAVDLDSA